MRIKSQSLKHCLKQGLSLSLSVLMLSGNVWAASSDILSADVRVTVTPANLRETIPIAGAARKVTLTLHGASVQDALRALARQGGFNVLIDDSVTGNISVDLHQVSIQDALETLKTYGHLAYSVDGNNLMVAGAASEKGKTYQKTTTRIIPLHNATAKMVANLLNQTLFADRQQGAAGANGNPILPVTADYHTNSLIVVGSPTDIKNVREHVAALDQPRQMKTWRLSQANVLDVATILSSSLFNEGQPSIIMGGAGGASTQLDAGQPSSMRVTVDNIKEGTGAAQSSQSSGSSGGTNGQTSVINNLTVRDRVKETQSIQVSNMGAVLVPDTRMNTLTLLGTAEQIAMAEALIPTLDRKVPQVVLEASLVEISETGRKELGSNIGYKGRYTNTGYNNSPGAVSLTNHAYSQAIGLATDALNPFESLFQLTGNPRNRKEDFVFQLNALISKNKAKILANPTVITSSDNEAIISIVDEIIKSVTITQGFGLPPSATTNIGEAGIVLNILPKVGADGSVSMRVRPVISTIADTRRDRFNNMVTLLSKREVLTQNTVLRDGETFILGGLIHNTNSQAIRSTPGLSQLPIVGALARNTTGTKEKTELVIMITPHIVNDDAQFARSVPGTKSSFISTSIAHPQPAEAGRDTGIVPVSLNGQASSGGVLPPMENVRVIGGPTEPNTATRMYRSEPIQPKSQKILQSDPRVLNRALPDDFNVMAPPTLPIPKTISDDPAALNGSMAGGPISDDAIRAIMNKFR